MTKIAIIGAGMVGLAQGIALAAKGMDVTIIDHEDPAKILSHEFDGRVSAVAWKSYKFLDRIGAWAAMKPYAEDIKDIRVSEFGSNLFLHFDSKDIGDEPFGYIVENRYIRAALYQRAKEFPNLKLIAPAVVRMKDEGRMMIEVTTSASSFILHPSLLIGADGKNSIVRKAAGIGEYRKSYKQSGIVTTIEHEKPHMGLAHEHFMPVGPFAVLPMQNNRSSLVWTEPNDIAHIYMNMSDEDFLAQIKKRVGYLGDIKLTGRRWSYPLELMHADNYVRDNVVLVGDAAHSIHPIAGQGVNLGFRDAEMLSSIIIGRAERGLLLTEDALQEYEEVRRFDNRLMITATDKLNILFSNNILPIKLARTLGLGAVNKIPPLRRVFMKYASGRTLK